MTRSVPAWYLRRARHGRRGRDCPAATELGYPVEAGRSFHASRPSWFIPIISSRWRLVLTIVCQA